MPSGRVLQDSDKVSQFCFFFVFERKGVAMALARLGRSFCRMTIK